MFSSGLRLTDLNDFIAPSQECIKPVKVEKQSQSGQGNTIAVGDGGEYYEVTKDGASSRLEEAKVTLNDCLACSGCVTSAETVLIAMQSHEELISVLNANAKAREEQRLADVKTVVVTISPQTRASFAAKHCNISTASIARRLTAFLKSIGVDYILDSALGTDLSLLASAQEFVDRYNNGNCNEGATPSPLLASWCPGWVCYAEKTHPEVIPHLSRVKSPQQMMGSVVKDYLARSLGKSPDTIYHTTVMPCYDKKLEASRDDFFSDIYRTRDVDCVITTGEMERLLKSYGRSIADFEKEEEGSISLDRTFKATPNAYSLSRGAGTSAGGYLEYILSFAARALFNISITPDQVAVPGGSPLVKHVNVRNRVDCREVTLCNPNTGEPLLRFAAFYGFRHLQNLVRKFKTGRCDYHYVEIAACPGACSNGGGQLRSENANPKALKDWAAHVEHLYRSVGPTQLPEENHTMNAILSDWLPQGLQSEHAKRLLLTNFRAVADSSQGGGGSNSSAVMVNW